MGIFDNLVNKLPFSDNEDEYDDDEMDNYEDEEEYDDASRGGFFGGRGRKNRQQDAEEEEEDYDDAPRRNAGRTSIKGNNNGGSNNAGRSGGNTQLSAIRGGRASMPSSSKMQVRVIKPSSFDQARQITDTLLAHRTVLLNLEGLDVNTAQRIVDFASGSCYALHGNFMKISHFIIVITPEDVDIAGDIAGGGRQDAVAGILGAAAQGGANMGGMDGGNANPYMNNTMNMNMNGGY